MTIYVHPKDFLAARNLGVTWVELGERCAKAWFADPWMSVVARLLAWQLENSWRR